MPEALPLRDYQRAAIDALHHGWHAGGLRLAVLLPTGAGKTVVFSHLAAEQHARGVRTLVIAHRDELIQQAAAKVRAVAPHLNVGIVKAERDEHQDADVIVASVQTLAGHKRRERIEGVGLVIVDEAHHAAAPTYIEVLKHFGCFDRTPTAGFTATMRREDGGLADVWERIVYTRDILEMIADRHLVNVRGKAVRVGGLDLDTVKTRAGDLQDGQLAQALDDSGAAAVVADAYAEFAADRAGVVFTPTVDTAKSMTDVLNARGIRTATVWGDMPKDERADTLRAYAAGDIQVLANCMVLTEGFDAPWASCAVIARPTKSAALYVQMVGRVLRPWEGKRDALVLDVMGASTRHKLATLADLTERELTVDDGESLAAAALDDDPDALPGLRAVAVDWQDISLFDESPVRWLRTHGGTWFIPAGDTLYFLLPGDEPGAYRIRRSTPAEGVRAPSPDPEYPLEFAMRWAEVYAERSARHLARRGAGWRHREPSPKQVNYCRFKRIAVPVGATAGEVSDLQAVHEASLRLDGLRRAA
ncbi:DEAD/DEAH box helicase [Streptomyces shenzhenensis]|uniref:DEAD/DEAH box helicase n=1 Tax=Streptomyces shenzhenensis TaxID=943815 RepID=UPI001F1F4080|nr:DEAD/DEAH box helicase [Streptomyces shenzhenensis]